jgi:hypothetical protein
MGTDSTEPFSPFFTRRICKKVGTDPTFVANFFADQSHCQGPRFVFRFAGTNSPTSGKWAFNISSITVVQSQLTVVQSSQMPKKSLLTFLCVQCCTDVNESTLDLMYTQLYNIHSIEFWIRAKLNWSISHALTLVVV